MKLTKQTLQEIIKEEVKSHLQENKERQALRVLGRVKQVVEQEFDRRGIEYRWIDKGGEEERGLAGEREYHLRGAFKDPDGLSIGNGTIISVAHHEIKEDGVYYRGQIYYSSGKLEVFQDGDELVKFMKERASSFKFPRVIDLSKK